MADAVQFGSIAARPITGTSTTRLPVAADRSIMPRSVTVEKACVLEGLFELGALRTYITHQFQEGVLSCCLSKFTILTVWNRADGEEEVRTMTSWVGLTVVVLVLTTRACRRGLRNRHCSSVEKRASVLGYPSSDSVMNIGRRHHSRCQTPSRGRVE